MTVSRRKFLKGAVAGAAGLAGASVVGCDPGSSASGGRTYTATVPGIAADGAATSPAPTGTSTPAAAFVVSMDPLTKKAYPNPNVPFPTFPYAGIVQHVTDGRVLALDGSGQTVARARYYPWRATWGWVTDPESVNDFTIREYADAMGVTFSIMDIDFVNSASGFGDAALVNIAEKIGNQMHVSFLTRAIFGGRSREDWQRMLQSWDSVVAALDEGKVPLGYRYVWDKTDAAVAFAESEGMAIHGMHLLWGVDLIPSIFGGGFTNDELLKILRFMVQVRVLKYRGRIVEWDIEDEAAAHIVFAANPESTFWYDRFGPSIIDQVARWAHQADPDAKLVLYEDHVIEDSTDNFKRIRAKVFELLQFLKTANSPVDKVGIENNLWIYLAPSRLQTLSTLRSIQAMGYQISSGETTIGMAKADPLWPILKTQTPAANPAALQATVFSDLLSAYLEAGNEFGVGALTDKTSWLAPKDFETRAAMFDENYRPKPAYFALLDVVRQRHRGWLASQPA